MNVLYEQEQHFVLLSVDNLMFIGIHYHDTGIAASSKGVPPARIQIESQYINMGDNDQNSRLLCDV